MAALAGEFGVLAAGGDGLLGGHDGGGGFERDAENDRLAIGNAALNAAGAVAGGADLAVDHAERVVVFAAGEKGPGKPRADLKALGGGNRQHRFGEIGFEFVENRFAEAGRAVADHALDHAADRIASGADGFDPLDHRLDHGGVAGADDVSFDSGGGDGGRIDAGGEILDGMDPGEDFYAGVEGVEDLPGHGGGGDTADGFAGGRAATARRSADAVFGVVGVIGVAGAVFGCHFIVGAGALVGVADEDGNGASKGEAVVDTGEDFGGVGLVAGGDNLRLTGAAAVEFPLDLRRRDGDAGWATIDDHAHSATVGFAVGVDAEQVAKSG